MPDDHKLSAGDFAAAFKGFLDQMAAQAPAADPFFRSRLTQHFGLSPTRLPIVAETFADPDYPNLQLALNDYVAEPGRNAALLGVSSANKHMMGTGLAELGAATTGFTSTDAPEEGAVNYTSLPSGHHETIACVQFGLYLIEQGASRLAVLVRRVDRLYGASGVTVEVMAPEQEAAEHFLGDIRDRMRRRNVYRGHIVSLASTHMDDFEVRFHHLPTVDRDAIVLPAGVLERIERQTVLFAAQRDRLVGAGRHLKRGLLFWGPPGTGKTLIAMYLARQMPGRTVLILNGQNLKLIGASCSMARLLQPATVILEDVDLIAEHREWQSTRTNALLFELLNEMDGLGEDADVLFVLTTNRPKLLEPALACRPGRIDEAIEVPLPDADCRSRLLDLYARGLTLELSDRVELVERLEGVSAAFVKELLRKAALFAAESSSEDHLTVTDRHLKQALYYLVVDGGPLTMASLGVAPPARRKPDCG